MAEPLKNMFRPETVRELADHLAQGASGGASKKFDRELFVKKSCRGLNKLELKERVAHIAQTLHECVGEDYLTGQKLILNGLPPRRASTVDVISAFIFWPCCDYVERFGQDEFEASMDALYELTMRFSAEFAIRPYILSDSKAVMKRLRTWVKDENVHVRRLVSEGTRPRLPWGQHLPALRKDPSPNLALLNKLYRDKELYVRRSVANHLGDIAKDHPDLAVEIAEGWLKKKDKNTEWVIRHGLRGLLKAGHADALALLGFPSAQIEKAKLSLKPAKINMGEQIQFALSFRSNTKQSLMIDYVIHHQKANGQLTPKVFKWKKIEANKGDMIKLEGKHSIRPISTRKYYPGEHRVSARINGSDVVTKSFQLTTVE